MHPSSFDESNCALGKPVDMTHEQCETLSIFRGESDGFPVAISCWRPTREELEEINRTGRVWLFVYGEGHPPVAVSGHHPFNVDHHPFNDD